MLRSDFYYELPQELIAQHPVEPRSASRLMKICRETGDIEHSHFYNLCGFLKKGDLLVMNDSRVIPARLYGVKEGTGAHMEFLLLEQKGEKVWEILVKPGKRAKPGTRFVFGEGRLTAEILSIAEGGNRIAQFYCDGSIYTALDEIGQMPLPPYITEKLEDKERYQTVYSRELGSSAAPTAGLHFTPELLDEIRAAGINTAYVTLHVGLGTFRPVKEDNILDHKMHSEPFTVTRGFLKDLVAAVDSHRVVAVGTTSTRCLESLYYIGVQCLEHPEGVLEPVSQWEPYEREYPYTVSDSLKALISYMEAHGMEKLVAGTSIIIVPGFNYRVVDMLVTNFHQPQSTLLLLISAFIGDSWKDLYDHALENGYRFLSYGDSSLLFRG